MVRRLTRYPNGRGQTGIPYAQRLQLSFIHVGQRVWVCARKYIMSLGRHNASHDTSANGGRCGNCPDQLQKRKKPRDELDGSEWFGTSAPPSFDLSPRPSPRRGFHLRLLFVTQRHYGYWRPYLAHTPTPYPSIVVHIIVLYSRRVKEVCQCIALSRSPLCERYKLTGLLSESVK